MTETDKRLMLVFGILLATAFLAAVMLEGHPGGIGEAYDTPGAIADLAGVNAIAGP